MREFTQMSFRGLFILLLMVGAGGLSLRAQVLKGINDAVNTATEPAKDASKVVKAVADPAKEINKTTKTVVEAPKKVVKEYDKLGNEIDRTKGEYEKTGDQVDKLAGNDKKKDPKDADSTAAKNDADAKAAAQDPVHKTAVPEDYKPTERVVPTPVVAKKAVDPMDVPRPVPPGSRDNKTASGPLPVVEGAVPDAKPDAEAATGDAKTDVEVTGSRTGTESNTNSGKKVSTDADADGKADATDASTSAVENPVDASTSAVVSPVDASTSSEEAPERYVEARWVPRTGDKRPKPDYSHSPARIALEKADFDIETLEDLFRYSNWEGPEREHTVRSVAHSLDELQQSIVEIKKLDPGQTTWRFEESYKDMKAAYIAEMKRGK